MLELHRVGVSGKLLICEGCDYKDEENDIL